MKFKFLHIRVPEETKDKLKEAAKLASQEQGRLVTVSALVTDAALKECQRLLKRKPALLDDGHLALREGGAQQ